MGVAEATSNVFCSRCTERLAAPEAPACAACGADRPATGWPRDRRLGTVIAGGQYRILRRLGAGGFGSVYLVETVVGGLRRALKVLNAEWTADEEMRARFVNEALVLEQVNHPNVARCYAAGTIDGHELYLLLELVDGVSLASVLDAGGGARRPLPPGRAVRIAKQVAAGLVVAHANHVLHRDLKPENILLVNPGAPDEQVKLIDFGIAKALDATGPATRGWLGTPHFMAPEQLQPEEGPPDARLDLWQLGVTLFVMLTGELPYGAAGGTAALADQQARHAEAGPAPGGVAPALAAYPALDRLVSRLLATRRERRPRSAAQVCAELARIEHALDPGTGARSTALLEALCAAPGESGWRAVCRYLAGHEEGREPLVAAADALLADWPDALRVASAGWWEAVRRGEPHRLWPLARALDLSARGLTDADALEVAGCAALATLTELSLADNDIGSEGAAALAASPHLAGLRALDLSRNRLTSAAAEAIAASPRLTRLETLRLAGNGLGPRGAAALARARLPLRRLDLSDNSVQAAGAAALAESQTLIGLEELTLAGNGLGSDGAGALAVSRTLAGLRALDLGQNGIGAGGAAALALSSAMTRLVSLSLACNSLGLQGVELLLSSSRFGALERLDLSSNGFGAQGAMLLASSPFTRRLKTLDLSDNQLGDAGLAALLGAQHLSGLRALRVAQNSLSAASATLLGSAPPELAELDISRNPLGPAGAQALAEALARTRVSTLKVNGCGLGAGDLAVVAAGGQGRLEALEAAANEAGPEGVEALGATAAAAALTSLDLAGNRLGPEGVERLGGAPFLKGLRALRLASNGFGDASADLLAGALTRLPSLADLALEDNGLAARSAAALAASPLAARLTRLNLAFNALGDAGGAALARGGGWHALQVLDLERNDISLGAAATILAAPGLALLSRVNFARNALTGLVDVHSLARHKVARLEATFATLALAGGDLAERFYAALFARHPEVRPLFAHTSMKRQQQHLFGMLAMVIDNLRNPDLVARELTGLGARHRGYGASPSHYYAVTRTLLGVIREVLADGWDEEIHDAWRDGLEAIAGQMLRGQQAAGPPAA